MFSPSDNILIVSLRRSGGKLLRRLLDGHACIRCLPFEHWQTVKKGRFPGEILQLFGTLAPEEKLAAAGLLPRTASKMEEAHGAKASEAFMEGLTEDAERCASSPDLYECFANRYFDMFRGIGPGARVVNHCGNLALMAPEQLDQVFGPSTKIVLWRDPRAVFVSSQAAQPRKNKPFAGTDLDEFCSEYETAYHNYSSWPGITLKFEDLVRDPEACMRSLASALGIEFSDVLLTPTTFGRPRNANSSFGRTSGAVDATAAADWESRIDPKDRAAIENRLGRIIEELGGSWSALAPAPGANGSLLHAITI